MVKNNFNVETKKMGNFDMASAADRILAFWEKYPKGKISTEQSKDADGLTIFKTFIWKNKSDFLSIAQVPGVSKDTLLSSADAEGTAKQENSKYAKKDFEKLETISVGRALAFIGFAKDGQVASSEEMERFYNYQEERKGEMAESAVEYLKEANNIEELRKRWKEVDREIQQYDVVVKAKDDAKLKLESGEVK